MRVYQETEGEGLPVYGNELTLRDVHRRFSYVFQPVMEGGGKPKVKTIDCSVYGRENPLEIGGISLIPVPLLHGRLETTGWIILRNLGEGKGIRGLAYLTDCNHVPQCSLELLVELGPCLEHVVIDGLRPQLHSTHFSYDQALELALQIGGRYNWLTHLCHDRTHVEIQSYLQERLEELGRGDFHCQPAYDGLVLEV